MWQKYEWAPFWRKWKGNRCDMHKVQKWEEVAGSNWWGGKGSYVQENLVDLHLKGPWNPVQIIRVSKITNQHLKCGEKKEEWMSSTYAALFLENGRGKWYLHRETNFLQDVLLCMGAAQIQLYKGSKDNAWYSWSKTSDIFQNFTHWWS